MLVTPQPKMGESQLVRKPKLVAIVGGSCSGKTWLAARLQKALGALAAHLSQDDFYIDRSHLSVARRGTLNFDHPRAIDWPTLENLLRDCEVGREVAVPTYDFTTHSRKSLPQPWVPKPIVIIDGLWLLRRRSLRKAFALSLFIDCPAHICRERRLKRDASERGRTQKNIEEQLDSRVFPMHDRFVAPQAQWADMILPHSTDEGDVQDLARQLKQLVSF